MDDGEIPILFLRYNPDNYQIDGVKHKTPQKKEKMNS